MALPLAVLGVLAVCSAGVGWPGAAGSTWFEHRVNDETVVGALMTKSSLATEESRALFEKQLVHEPDAPAREGESPHEPQGLAGRYAHAWHASHAFVFWFSLIIAPSAIGLAYFFFMMRRGVDYVSGVPLLRGIRTALENLWYVDDFFVKGVVPWSKRLFAFALTIDKYVIDWIVNAAAWFTERFAWVSGRVDFHGVDGAVRGTGEAVLEGGQAARRLVTGKINDYVMFTVLGLAALAAAVAFFGN